MDKLDNINLEDNGIDCEMVTWEKNKKYLHPKTIKEMKDFYNKYDIDDIKVILPKSGLIRSSTLQHIIDKIKEYLDKKVDESMKLKENLNSKILYKIYNYDLDKYEKRLTSNINKVKDYLKANIGDEIAIFVNEFKLVKEKEVYNEEKDMKVSALYNFPDSGKQIKKQVIKEENIDKIINSLTQCTNNSTEDLKYFDIKVADNGELKNGYLVYGNPKPFNDYYNFYDVTYKANNKQFSIIAAVRKSLESVRDIDKYLLLNVLPEVNNSLVHSVKYIEDIEVKKKKLTESLNENNDIQLHQKYQNDFGTIAEIDSFAQGGYTNIKFTKTDGSIDYSTMKTKDVKRLLNFNNYKLIENTNETLENKYEDEVIESYNILDEDIREKEYNVVIDNIEWSAENEDLPSSIQHDFFLSPYDNLEDEIYKFLLEYSNGIAPLGYSIDYNQEDYYVDDNIDEDEVYYGESWSNGSFSYMTPLDYIERDLQDENINYELTQVDDYTYITIQDNQDNIRKADDIICNIVGDQYEKINKGNEVDFKIPDNELNESLKEVWTNGAGQGYKEGIDYLKEYLEDANIDYSLEEYDDKTYVYCGIDNKEEVDDIIYQLVGDNYEVNELDANYYNDYEFIIPTNALYDSEDDKTLYYKNSDESLKESTNISSNNFGVAKMYGPSSLNDLEKLAKQKEKVYLEQEWGGKVHGFWIAASTLARQLKNGQAKIYDETSDKSLKEDFNQQQLTQEVIKALNSTNDIVYHKDYEIYPEDNRLKLVFERVSKRDNAWGALWEFDKEDDEVEWQYIYVYGKDNSGLKENKNEAIEYGKGKYEPKKITAFNHYTAPKYNSELHKKFQDDAKKEEYWIVKEDSWYDPEDLSSITNSITFAGSKEDCENTLKQIKNDAHNDKNVNIENEGNDFIEIYYPNNISRVTYRLVKNNNKNESLKEFYRPNYFENEYSNVEVEDINNLLDINLEEEGIFVTIKTKKSKYSPKTIRKMFELNKKIYDINSSNYITKIELELREVYDESSDNIKEAVYKIVDYINEHGLNFQDEDDDDDIDESLKEDTLQEFKYDLTDDEIAKAKTIKLVRGDQRGYKCGTDWYYKDNLIEREDSNFGGALQWYCDDLFPGQTFDSLIEVKYAIYKLEHKNDKKKDESLNEEVPPSDKEFTLNFYDEDESNGRYDYIDSKQVYDSDGFITEYTMYYDTLDNKYVFVFGDSDLYKPEDEDFDWECETRDEAEQWFRNYNGFEDDLDECNLKESNDPLDNIIADDLKKQLDKNITRILSPATGNWIKDDIPTVSREEYAVRYYFGIGDMADWTPHSIKEIADRFQVKPNRIRLFLKNGIKKLQDSKYFQGKDLSDFKQLLTSNESLKETLSGKVNKK